MTAEPDTSLEERLRRAEAALEESLAERNRLWEQLNGHLAAERERDALRERLHFMEQSPSWRLTAPLRRAKAVVAPRRALLRTGLDKLRDG